MKKINIKQILLATVILFALLFKYWSIWGLADDSIKYIFFIASIFLSVINIIVKKFSKREIRKIVILLVISIIICYSTGEIDFIYSLLLAIIFVKEENGDYLFIKYFVIFAICLFLLTITMWKIGVINSFESVRLVNGVLTRRNSLGFEHVNAVFKNFFPICLGAYMLSYDEDKKKRIALYVIMIVTGFLLYKATDSRTGFYAILMIAPLDYMISKVEKHHKLGITKYFFLIFSIISVIIAFVFGKSNNSINELLSDRPILYYQVLTQSKVSLFSDANKGIVDNTYIWLLYHRGLIVYITYLTIYIKSTKKLINNKMFVLPLQLFCMYATLENLDVYNYNFLLIIQLMIIIKSNKVKYMWIYDGNREKEIK